MRGIDETLFGIATVAAAAMLAAIVLQPLASDASRNLATSEGGAGAAASVWSATQPAA